MGNEEELKVMIRDAEQVIISWRQFKSYSLPPDRISSAEGVDEDVRKLEEDIKKVKGER